MAQDQQMSRPVKAAIGLALVAVIALAGYFMQPKPAESPAESPAVAQTPEITPAAPDPAPETVVATPILPTLDVVRVTPDGQATIAGSAAPEAKVSLRVDGAEIANAPADTSGAYASLFSLPASDKARILTVAATGADGIEVLGKDQVVLAPTAATPAPLKITEEGVQVLEPAKIADNIVINSITYDDDKVTVGGLGQADQSVRLYVDGAEAGSTQIAANGTWSATLSQIAPGVYTLRADQLDGDGKVTSRYETPFKRESTDALAAATTTAEASVTPEEPAAAKPPVTVTVQPGLTLWQIAQENFGSGTLYVQVFEANKDLIRDPDLIYPGQVFTIPTAP
jgi:LysM repeat protein